MICPNCRDEPISNFCHCIAVTREEFDEMKKAMGIVLMFGSPKLVGLVKFKSVLTDEGAERIQKQLSEIEWLETFLNS